MEPAEGQPSSEFGPLTLPDGTEVLADAETRRFFANVDHLPDPSNETLSRIWRGVSRVRLFDGGMINGEPLGDVVMLELADAAELAELFKRLEVVEPAFGAHCMCFGDQAFELRDQHDNLLAVLGLHHGDGLRWDGWSCDAELKNGPALMAWLRNHGVVI